MSKEKEKKDKVVLIHLGRTIAKPPNSASKKNPNSNKKKKKKS